MALATSDYERLTKGVGLVDRSDRGKLLLTGAEAAEYLQGQVTNDVESLAAGDGCYAMLLTHKGKAVADMRVLRGRDWIRIDTEAHALPSLARNVEMYSIGRDVQVTDESADRAILSLVGPEAASALDAEPPADEHAWVEGRHGMYVRTDLGIDILCPAEQAGAVRDALGIEAVAAEAAEVVRIETGRPRHGVDFGSETIPQEAGLNERAVSFTKGCYVGQETVARLHYKGKPNRHLRGLKLSEPADTGDAVVLGDREVGRLGSTGVSPAHGPIALAVLRREAGPGAEVAVGDSGAKALVVDVPFG